MTNRQIDQAPSDRMTLFGYEADAGRDFPKKSIRLARTETLTTMMGLIEKRSENSRYAASTADTSQSGIPMLTTAESGHPNDSANTSGRT